MNSAIVLRKIAGRFDAFFRHGATYIIGGRSPVASQAGGAGMAMLAACFAFALVILPALLGLAFAAYSFHLAGPDHAGVLTAAATLALPAGMKKKKDDLDAGLKELEKLQEKMATTRLEPKEGERCDQLVQECAVLQEEIDRWYKANDAVVKGRQVDNPLLPASMRRENLREEGLLQSDDEVVAYLTLGKAFTESDAYQELKRQGFPAAREVIAPFAASFHSTKTGYGVVPLTRKMIAEMKAVPTIGAGVIRPSRDPEVVRYVERTKLTIRDLLNKATTDSNSIEYVTVSDFTRAAAPVADSGLKPEAAITYGTGTAPVRTLAVTMPITEQQLQDVAGLQNTIDEELTWDLKKTEEEQLVWGDGTGQNLLGIFPTPGIGVGRTVGGDTLIDQVRRMITDIGISQLEPNGVVMDPLDWESVLLTKATTGEYIWAVVTTENGNRLWGVNVVETVAMREPGAYTTNERRVLVGDFRRGATLWDRQQAGVQIGWVNDQFRRNQRTVRAEERLAFGVRRTAAFRYRITQARVP